MIENLEKSLSILNTNDIVAFKTKETLEWFTGKIQFIYPPNFNDNYNQEWQLSIVVNEPNKPQWDEDEHKFIYYLDDIVDIIYIEQ